MNLYLKMGIDTGKGRNVFCPVTETEDNLIFGPWLPLDFFRGKEALNRAAREILILEGKLSRSTEIKFQGWL
jgi:hypothetical protein